MKQTSRKTAGDTAITRDYRGLKCPLPVLKARRALSELSSGGELEILADDPAAPLDMAHFCDTEGHQLALSEDMGGYFRFIMIKGYS